MAANKTRLPSEKEFQLLCLAMVEHTGRDLAKAFKAETGRTISYGTLYPTMARLERAKLVATRVEILDYGKVKWFLITATGRKVLDRARQHYTTLTTFGLRAT